MQLKNLKISAMKKIYKSLRLLPVILLGLNLTASAQSTVFSYTPGVQTYTVPANVYSVNVIADGARGGDNTAGTSQGANGGRSVVDLNVTPGQILYVYVGGAGGPGVSGGFNGGGSAATSLGGSGGGASDVRTGGTALSNRVIVAGGGGGAGYDCAGPPTNTNRGGQGGGLTGQTGYLNDLVWPSYSYGGNQISGFAVGLGGPAVGNGGGGGGGYYGGLAGTSTAPPPAAAAAVCASGAGGAGGGSAYADASMISSATFTIGGATAIPAGNGVVTICAPGVAGTIVPSDSVCVGATVPFSDGTGTPGGVWSTSNGNATVNPVTGDVTGVTPGAVEIIYDVTTPCGNAQARRWIIVRDYPQPITGTLSACTGATSTLADVTPGGTWTSSAPTIGSIGSTSGVVTGLVGGTTNISYSDGGCKVGVIFTVIQGPDTIVGPKNTCVGYPSLYTDVTTPGTWSTTVPPADGTIDATTGAFTGFVSGLAPIIYTAGGGCTSVLNVLVNDPPGTIFGTNTICSGTTTTLIEFGFGGAWSNKFPAISSVDPSGNVTGLAGGPDTVYYTIGGCPPAEFPMWINQVGPILGISSVCIGSSVALSDTTLTGTWSSSDASIAYVDPVTGVMTAGPSATIGSPATISYTIPFGCYATLDVTANTSAPGIIGADSICQGTTTSLTDTLAGGTWTSTDLAIAQVVDTSGFVTGISSGYVNVSYTLSSGCYAAKLFHVLPLTTASAGLTRFPPNDTLCQNTTVHFKTNPSLAGAGPVFHWSLFGTPMGSSLDTFDYIPKHGDVVVVTMIVGSGVCAAADTVMDSVTYNIDSNISPIITIAKTGSPDSIKFLGQEITFFSETHYGGDAPTYQWYVNRVAVPGATSASFKTPVYVNDTVYCAVTGNPPCAVGPTTALSNIIVIYNHLDVKTVSGSGNSISLFPNPTTGKLSLTGKVSGNSAANIEISDMLGRIVYTGTTTPVNGTLSMQIVLGGDIANGSYLLRVNTETSSEVMHFVISK